MILLYTFLYYLVLPLVLLRLVARGFRNPGYWRRWDQRFGYCTSETLSDCVWIHAVSVGETQAAAPLVRALLAGHPETRIVFTTTTATGSERARALFGDRVVHSYMPFDLPGPLKRFLGRVRPRVTIVFETELWPNMFRLLRRRGVSIIVANARISDHSLRGYMRLRPLLRQVLGSVDFVAARGDDDAERFRSLGARPDSVHVIGNVKFDIEVPKSLVDEASILREACGRGRPIWVAGSTHEGEESQVLDAHAAVRRTSPNALLVLVPRHPERFDRVAALCATRGWKVARRSRSESPAPPVDVLLGDTMGELTMFYAAADVAFLGGSLVPIGGHNMLEASVLGVPVVVGPHVENFREVEAALAAADALVRVRDAESLAATVGRLLRDGEERRRMGANGRRLIDSNRGAVDRLVEVVNGTLEPA